MVMIKLKDWKIELAPALVNFGVTQHLTWKNPEIQTIFDEAEQSLKKIMNVRTL